MKRWSSVFKRVHSADSDDLGRLPEGERRRRRRKKKREFKRLSAGKERLC